MRVREVVDLGGEKLADFIYEVDFDNHVVYTVMDMFWPTGSVIPWHNSTDWLNEHIGDDFWEWVAEQ
jgi:hypothetical protein